MNSKQYWTSLPDSDFVSVESYFSKMTVWQTWVWHLVQLGKTDSTCSLKNDKIDMNIIFLYILTVTSVSRDEFSDTELS